MTAKKTNKALKKRYIKIAIAALVIGVLACLVVNYEGDVLGGQEVSAESVKTFDTK